MSREIIEKARILAEAIAQSRELEVFRGVEKTMSEDTVACEIIQEFNEVQTRLMQSQESGGELTNEEKQAAMHIEEKMSGNPLIAAFLQAQKDFSEILREVNAILGKAIAKDQEAGGCDCGCSGGCETERGSGCDCC